MAASLLERLGSRLRPAERERIDAMEMADSRKDGICRYLDEASARILRLIPDDALIGGVESL